MFTFPLHGDRIDNLNSKYTPGIGGLPGEPIGLGEAVRRAQVVAHAGMLRSGPYVNSSDHECESSQN
jgi:hypothetical protein